MQTKLITDRRPCRQLRRGTARAAGEDLVQSYLENQPE